MQSALFVHGTGVRLPSYDESFTLIKEKLAEYLPGSELKPCYWGGTEGCQLRSGGASIPDYETARAINDVGQEDASIAEWRLLYQDPDWELDLLMAQPGPARTYNPAAEAPLEALSALLARETERSRSLVNEIGLQSVWDKAKSRLRATLSTAIAANRTIPELDGQFRAALARALVAHAVNLRLADVNGSYDWPTGSRRDALVGALSDAWGGTDRSAVGGVASWIGDRFKRIALNVGTDRAARKRDAISDASYPAAGDILLYQARGDGIRSFIERAIRDAPKPLLLLAHSLGGVACVDLLIEKDLDGVEQLITVGSQAPLFYELNALSRLQFGESLPQRFPHWLNFYDKHDFLSYIGAGVFPDRVQDVLVHNGQPFPQAHSAYWNNPEVWNAIKGSLSCHRAIHSRSS